MIRIWDIAFFIFALLPYFTGGLWINKDHLKLEYTQAGIPAIILLAVFYWGVKKRNWQFENSFFLRNAIQAGSAWKKNLELRPLTSLSLLATLFSFLWFLVSVRRHLAFESSSADLGIFTNAVWNLSQGLGYFSSLKGGVNLLSDHQSYIFLLWGPLFAIFPHVNTLFLTQAIFFASSVFPIYFLAKQYAPKDSNWPAWMPWLFCLFLPLRNAIRFDFHPEITFLPLALFGIAGIQSLKNRYRLLGLLCLTLSLFTKESASPVVFGVALAWALGAGPIKSKGFSRLTGVVFLFISLGFFIFNFFALPKILHFQYSYTNVYSHLGASTAEIVMAPFTKPLLVLSSLLDGARLKFLIGLFLPFLFLPAFRLPIFASIPAILLLFLTQGDQRVSLGFHYAVEPSLGLFWALASLGAAPFWQKREPLLLGLIFCASLIMTGRSDVHYLRRYEITPHEQWLNKSFLPQMKEMTNLSASSALVPHLARRPWIQQLPVIQKKSDYVDCVLVDPSVNNSPLNLEQWRELQALLEKNYRLEYSCGSLRLFILQKFADSCLKEKPTCPIQ